MEPSLSLTVSDIVNGDCDAMVNIILNDHTTSYSLSIVTVALGRTV